ncbi:hypothetical protein NYQ10_02575 [Flavobacterium johnsoniae]|uniref:hypothetical protein n=1 Tax=Flavobacterium TaxID=237 RepID=UPI0023E41214|nr:MULTISPECIES: hypothetical protein [Flavobacterium]WET01047.1 hypothetical protein P0R33_14835 [Flavobacterium sp. YJ01]WJS95345.1 hypothetical protein NYQ10_02575 [Flavobacterium johnsoniae]
MKKTLLYGFLMLFISCNDLPKEDAIRNIIKSKIAEESFDNAELVDFNIVRTLENTSFGHTLDVEFTGKVKYLNSGYVRNASLLGTNTNEMNFLIIVEKVSESNNMLYDYLKVKKGMIKEITGSVQFVKGADLFDKSTYSKPDVWDLNVGKNYGMSLKEIKNINGYKR